MEQWPRNILITSNAMDFFNKLLEFEPLKRYSCQQALRHDWLIDIFQHKQQYQYVSPRLTPLQDAVESSPSQQMENRKINKRIRKKLERKYKDHLDDNNDTMKND